MIVISPSAAKLVKDLVEHGIDLKPLGDAIRFRPRHAMTPNLMERLQTHKAEVLAMLDTDSALAELRRFVAALWQNHDWRRSWEHRFREAKYANLDSLRRVPNIVIDLAEEHHRRHDWKAFDSARKYLHRLASGEEWDGAKPIQDENRWNIDP